jgi:2-polyprenyl-3-methyl-5-hydroxy-6-metoxy-1,4-benzoquinol methylase
MTNLTIDPLYENYITSGQHPAPTIADYESWSSAAERRFKGWLPRGNTNRCLDLGSGCGQALYMLRRYGYQSIKGLDLSAECVSRAQSMCLPVYHADAISWLGSSSEQFDVILAIDLLEHLGHDAVTSLLREVYRHLSSGGVFIAQTVNGESPMFGQIRYGDFTHRSTFTKKSLSALLRHAGFSETEFRPVAPYPHGPMSAGRAVAWKFLTALLKGWNLIETGDTGSGIFTRNLILAARKRTTKPDLPNV